jgi:hypothetical protein
MVIRKLLLSAVVILSGSGAAFAGPCATAVDHMQNKVDAFLSARAAAGPTAQQSVGATLRHQPTPESIAAAEAKLGDLSPETVEAIALNMTRARQADDSGDAAACEAALSEVERTISPRAD